MKIITLILFILGFSSCTNKPLGFEDKLKAKWMLSNKKNGYNLYGKSESLNKEKLWIRFNNNGEFLKRDYNNWCGNANGGYEIFKGSWEINSDSTLTIQYETYFSKINEDWVISTLSNDILKLKLVDRNTEKLYSNR